MRMPMGLGADVSPVVAGAAQIILPGSGEAVYAMTEGQQTQRVPMRVGVAQDVAQRSCVNAGGTWNSDLTCTLPVPPALPDWCGWVPFATSLFPNCKLPSTPADLAAYSAYTAYQSGMISGDPTQATQVMDEGNQQSQQLLQDPSGTGDPAENCKYNAAANNPALAQMIGPTLTCALTDPFHSGGMGIVLWLFIGFVAYAVIKK